MPKKLFLWVEKFRPRTVDDCILSDVTKAVFKGYVEQGEIPNLLLPGSAGIGKTTVAKALCEEIGLDYILVNGSDEGRHLDTVRTKIKSFASSQSLVGGNHKVIIIDEADNTTPDVQLILRAVIEEFQNNCRFIFTCNYLNKIIDPLRSRCSIVDLSVKVESVNCSLLNSSTVSVTFSMERMLNMKRRSLQRLLVSISLTSVAPSTSCKHMHRLDRSMLASLVKRFQQVLITSSLS